MGNAVDGAGLSPHEHARAIAARLKLTRAQSLSFVAELRNALVPAAMPLKAGDEGPTARGIERVLLLANAIQAAMPPEWSAPPMDPSDLAAVKGIGERNRVAASNVSRP